MANQNPLPGVNFGLPVAAPGGAAVAGPVPFNETVRNWASGAFSLLNIVLLRIFDAMSVFQIHMCFASIATTFRDQVHQVSGQAILDFVNNAPPQALAHFGRRVLINLVDPGNSMMSNQAAFTELCRSFAPPAETVRVFCATLFDHVFPVIIKNVSPKSTKAKLLPKTHCDSFNNKALGTDEASIKRHCSKKTSCTRKKRSTTKHCIKHRRNTIFIEKLTQSNPITPSASEASD